MRHGPHHGAQKSTTASPSCFSISLEKVASVSSTEFDIVSFSAAIKPLFVSATECKNVHVLDLKSNDLGNAI